MSAESSSSSSNKTSGSHKERVRALCTELTLSECAYKYVVKEVEDVPKDALEQKLAEIKKSFQAADYELIDEIGRGAFGAVYRGRRRKDGVTVAIKIIDLEESRDDIQTITKEITTLAAGKTCPQLIDYFGSTVMGTKLWIAMEYVDGGSVLDVVKQNGVLTEPQIAYIVREILLGLQYLSMEGKVHRDIKAANVLLAKNGQVKLADFGATAQLTDTMTKCGTFVGSPYWMAPEVMTQSKYDYTADIWSLGITCIEMATGFPPYHSVHPLKLITMIPRQPPPPAPKGASKEFEDFIAKCLIKDPDKRMPIKELLKLPFILKAPKEFTSSSTTASQ